jgi:hypothetical protein
MLSLNMIKGGKSALGGGACGAEACYNCARFMEFIILLLYRLLKVQRDELTQENILFW